MKKIFTLCIWHCGPGRPYDNRYLLVEQSYRDNVMELSFDDDEKCIIVNPIGVAVTKTHIKIERADKILWSHYYYGKPKSAETLMVKQYEWIGNDQVRVIETGPSATDRIVSVKNQLAFDAYITEEP